MLNRITQITIVALMASLLSGCPKPYLAFEKHGGAFLVPVGGQQFVHQPNTSWDTTRSAMVYFYRPNSKWGSQEIDSPSLYVDNHRYIGLRANGYTWLEMEPGTRHIIIRRPIGLLLGFEGIGSFSLEKTVDAEIELQPGEVYYFRYSEIDTPEERNPNIDPDHPLAQGDLQLVTRDVAIKEIVDTRFMISKPPFTKHNSAVSIVETNKEDDYKKEVARLEEKRAKELEELKAKGYWRSASWYWPFGGGPTRRLKSDIEREKLDSAREAYLEEQQRIADAEWERNKPAWWPL